MYRVRVIGNDEIRKFYFLRAHKAGAYGLEMAAYGYTIDLQSVGPLHWWRKWRDKVYRD